MSSGDIGSLVLIDGVLLSLVRRSLLLGLIMEILSFDHIKIVPVLHINLQRLVNLFPAVRSMRICFVFTLASTFLVRGGVHFRGKLGVHLLGRCVACSTHSGIWLDYLSLLRSLGLGLWCAIVEVVNYVGDIGHFLLAITQLLLRGPTRPMLITLRMLHPSRCVSSRCPTALEVRFMAARVVLHMLLHLLCRWIGIDK